MKVELLNNIDAFTLDIENILEEDEQTIVLVQNKFEIDSLIENSKLDDELLLKLKIAYNFELKAELINLKTGISQKVNSIKDIIENITEDIRDYQLIFDEITNEELAEVIQQFIYLSIPLDIVTKEELKYINIFNNYKKM